jgi:murein DD-endopeptidase MepM/ murein hydrolase activator NlpD
MNRLRSLILHTLCTTALIVQPALASPPPSPVPQPAAASGEDVEPPHDELSPAQEQAMWEEIHHNLEMLRSTGALAPVTSQTVTYNFPLRLAPGVPGYAGFRVSAFVDHNPTSGSGAILDYNSGTRTYDGHRGTDYALWPFSWNKLDAGEMQVIAAAAGKIVGKENVDSTDHNCGSSISSERWNYVALLHADGRMTLYGHMRYNSLTSKGMGQTVAQGEYLGTVASSGNSSGPHLHFEVRYGSYTDAEWIDPYAGPSSQPESLWASQRPYIDSAINRIATHSAPPSTPDLCLPTITNLQDSFTTPRTIYFYTYYRDYQGTLATQFKLYRPDGSLSPLAAPVSPYTPGSPAFSSVWSYYWTANFSNSEPAGTWRFEVTYNGQVYETFFNVNAPPTVTVSSPNGGEQWPLMLPHSVTWTDNFGGDVNIALYHNGVYSATLASNTPSDGDYQWIPDITLAPGPGYTLRVISVISPTVYDQSNASFTLLPASLIARNDFALTPINTSVTINALSNDEDPSGNPLTITALGSPISGTVSLVNSNLVYTPTVGFLGTDVFTYTASANTKQADATVTVVVAAEVFKLFSPLMQR